MATAGDGQRGRSGRGALRRPRGAGLSIAQRAGVSAILAAFCVGCSVAEAPRPSVVCILIDQLRKDAADQHMRVVNALAAGGVVFEQMRATSPWTYPSVVSLLSGLYPQQHGADGHATEDLLSYFDPELPLVQKRLRAAGYATAAFVANPFLLEWNAFHYGFETFDGHFVRSQGHLRGYEKVWVPETMFASSVNAAVRAHFDARPYADPEFTYIHYIDVHGPWRSAPFAGGYVGSIRFVDRKVAELYDYFTARYQGDVLFFVTSDHGRDLGDDVTVGYGPEWRKGKHSVHDFNIRVPFAILPSKRVAQSRRIEGPSSQVDFVPTLLEWLDLPARQARPGVSLLPTIAGGEPLGRDRGIYARHSAFGSMNDGVVYRGRKYVRFFDVVTGELIKKRVFDLENDPLETESLGEEFGEAEAVLEEVSGTQGVAYPAVFREMTPEVEEQLRALGYLGGRR
jgi:arylsulfatase A-like enzyme